MDPLAELTAALAALPWSRRRRLTFAREKGAVSVRQGSMAARVRLLEDGRFEITYEPAFHELTRVQLPPQAVMPFLLQVLGRENLHLLAPPPPEDPSRAAEMDAEPEGPGSAELRQGAGE